MNTFNYQPDIQYSMAAGKYGFLDLYIPEAKGPHNVIIYFHGGGLEGGDKADEKQVFEWLAKSGMAVASANYRVYPDAKYPDFIQDAAQAVGWVRKHASEYGLGKFLIGGSSAGAYLSMMLFFAPEFLGSQGLKFSDFNGYLFDAGQPTVHYNILRERGEDTRLLRLDKSAPLYRISKDYSEERFLPKIQILASSNDMPGRLEQNRLLYSTIINFGYPAKKIGFQLMQGYGHCEYTGLFRDGDSILGHEILKLTDD